MPHSNFLRLPNLRCDGCPVRSQGICCALTDEHLDELSNIMVHREFTAGSEILHQEDTSELFAIILAGTVKLSRVLENGRQQIVGLLSQTDSLGRLYSEASHDTAECVTDVTLCCFPRKRFEAILKRHPEVGHQLFLRAMSDLNDARDWILVLGQKKTEERVASFLLWLWQKQYALGANEPVPADALIINCPFSRREIGEFLGVTIETVSRKFSKFRAAGAIALPTVRQIEIKDLDMLRRLAEQER